MPRKVRGQARGPAGFWDVKLGQFRLISDLKELGDWVIDLLSFLYQQKKIVGTKFWTFVFRLFDPDPCSDLNIAATFNQKLNRLNRNIQKRFRVTKKNIQKRFRATKKNKITQESMISMKVCEQVKKNSQKDEKPK